MHKKSLVEPNQRANKKMALNAKGIGTNHSSTSVDLRTEKSHTSFNSPMTLCSEKRNTHLSDPVSL